METSTVEFSPIKTIKLINKDTLLKNVYNESNPGYNFMVLTQQAKEDKLPVEVKDSLQNIFDAVIVNRDTYLNDYKEIEEVEKTPRRYGKQQIEKDIASQGGFATDLQKTMLDLNDLKSMYLNLNGKGVSDQYKGTEKFSDEDLRAIRSAILTFKKKVGHITKRKR